MKFDITEYLELVFPFQEADADKCFLHFEKVAGNGFLGNSIRECTSR